MVWRSAKRGTTIAAMGETVDVLRASPSTKPYGFGEEIPVRVLPDPHRENAYSLSAAACSIELAACRARSASKRSA